LVKPDFGISTKWVYDNFDLVFVKEKRLVGTHVPTTAIHLYNDLEKVVIPKYPAVEEIKKKLIRLGCLQSVMSGSGPTVFGLAKDEGSANKIYLEIKKQYPQSFLVRDVNSGLST
jgi:4-diphosphocytidyl-2-C-methyl-D-erythritol kinase